MEKTKKNMGKLSIPEELIMINVSIFGDDELCRFYRVDEPMKFLIQSGDVSISDINKSNFIIVNRNTIKKNTIQNKNNIIYSFDDLFWKFDINHSCYPEFILAGILNEADFWINRCCKLIVSTKFLATWTEIFKNKKSFVIENAVPDRWVDKRKPLVKNTVILSLGNKGHDHDIIGTGLYNELPDIIKNNDVISLGRSNLNLLNSRKLDHTFNTEEYFNNLTKLTGSVGLIPLIDDSFNRAKSNIKALEYVSAGITPLFSPVGEYNGLGAKFNKFIKNKNETWNDAINRVRDISIKSFFEYIKEYYVVSKVANKWLEFLI
jgi:hypothetical protein